MKPMLRLTALLAAVLLLAACKPETLEVLQERDIVYTVGTDRNAAHLKTDAEWDALLERFCNYAAEGSAVTFYNSVSHGGTVRKAATKDAVTYSTTSREEMKQWMRRMEDAGMTVTVTYDSGTGTWNGMAYASASSSQSECPFDSRGATLSLFSVSEDSQVRFSRGNLQYHSVNNTWQMAAEQYVGLGENAEWTTLFDWNTNDTQPWMAGHDTVFSGLAGQWRMLNEEEWRYLLEYRSASPLGGATDARYAQVSVDGVRGLLLFPDSYSHPAGIMLPVSINASSSAAWNANSYTQSEWALIEEAGAVFLPLAGYRSNGSATHTGTAGRYWVAADIIAMGYNALYIDDNMVAVSAWFGDMETSIRLVCGE
ncbi:MAG: hypothetical protein IKX32_03735 [Bacteroidales bacterium]|nr:hypothetical protein [Bacteroidales bacterium]